MFVVIRGAGDIASGIALRLHRAGMHVVMCDLAQPLSIRRTVCFSEAIRLGEVWIEDVHAVRCSDAATARAAAFAGYVAVLVDERAACVQELAPDVVVDAILAKRNLGTTRDMAPVVVAAGPGFTAQVDCDAVVETMRGHYLGRVYYEGSAIPNTAVPGLIGGYAGERVMRAPADGEFKPCVEIGTRVHAGDICATVAGKPMCATIDGVVRGLLQEGVPVRAGMKAGDVDPRCHEEYIRTVSDKASAVGGGVLEAILALRNRAVGQAARVKALNGSFSDIAFVEALLAELEAGKSVGLATLLATRGSMPRHEGARLALTADGVLLGTVGGGAIEQLAIERARAASASGHATLEWVNGESADMVCGGDALLAVRPLGTSDVPVFRDIRSVLQQGMAAVLREDWNDRAAPVIKLLYKECPSCAGWDERARLYAESVSAPSRLHVFGAGHVGAALVDAAVRVGFDVFVYDDRPDLATAAALPAATQVRCGAFDELAKRAPIGPCDSVVVLTHGHHADETVLQAVLMREVQPSYVGCIGSRRKSALSREHLLEAGVPPKRVAAVHMPIGESIGAVTPAEIAISIVAELIRCRAEQSAE